MNTTYTSNIFTKTQHTPSSIKTYGAFLLLFLSAALYIAFFFFLAEYIPCNKILFVWGSIFLFIYLLISGFVFFGKRYNFSKFTNAISRFWKRSFSIFWLLESFLFLIFVYLTLNSSSEVTYMFDLIGLKKNFFFSWRLFSFKLLVIVIIILFLFILTFLSYDVDKNFFFLLGFFISVLSVYLLWLDFCQFLHFLNHCNYYIWNFSADVNEFFLENELRRSKIVKNYVLICVIAKFWHLVFIVFFWFFNFNRTFELKEQKNFIINTCLQNFLILYILNWISMYSWIKFFLRKYLNLSFFWFFNNNEPYLVSELSMIPADLIFTLF